MYKDSLAKYYQNKKEILQKKSLVKNIKVFLEKKKKKKQRCGCEQYKDLSEDGKQRLVE